MVRHPAAPPTSCMTSEDTAVTPAHPRQCTSALGAAPARCLLLKGPVGWAMPAVAAAVWAGRCVRPIGTRGEPRCAAPRAEQPAQVVCGARPAAGLFLPGLTRAHTLALLQGQVSPELHPGALQYSQAAVWVLRHLRGRGTVTRGRAAR